MATFVPPKVSTQFIYYRALVQQASTLLLKSSPTLASGDFKVSIDGGALANLGTLPTVTPAASVMVKLTLSTSEMAGANATVVGLDAAGAEWCDFVDNFQTAARQIDDLAYPATSGRSMVVDASGLVDANAVKVGPTGSGTAQTARDIGASVLLSTGTGTGQLDFTSGIVKANLAQILGTALTETAGQIAAAFKKWFDVATPSGTVNSIPNATAGANGGLFIAGTNAATTVTTSLTTTFTGNLTGSVASVTGAVGSVTGNVGGNVTGSVGSVVGLTASNLDTTVSSRSTYAGGAVASVTGNVGGNVVGSVASVTAAVAITSNIKKNQALAKFEFLMTDATTHAPKTGLTVAVTRSIDGGAFAAGALSAVTEIGSGVYSVDFAAGDLNGNVITLQATEATSDTTYERIVTQP